MPQFPRTASFVVRWIPMVALAFAICAPASSAQHSAGVQTDQTQIAQTISTEQIQNLPLPADEYGAGAYRLISLTPGIPTTKWKDFDPTGTLREDAIIHYTPTPGSTQKIDEQRDYYNGLGRIEEQTFTKWNSNGALNSYEYKMFDPRGYPVSDHITDYKLDLRIENNWYSHTHGWETESIPYNPTPTPAPSVAPVQSGTSMLPPSALTTETVGFLFPRDYQPDDTLTGSMWKSSYAEAFKTVPGLSESSFPIQTYNLPNGTPTWAGTEIGVKGYGYVPVQSDGEFSLHVPIDWKGPLMLQARNPDLIGFNDLNYGNLQVGDPVAAPALPQNLVPSNFAGFRQRMSTAHLIELWNEAYNLELELADAEESGASDEEWGAIDEDLGECYDDIDYLTAHLPTEVVVRLAHDMADETRAINEVLRKDTLTDDQESELKEYDGWANFLDDEADEASHVKLGALLRPDSPFWTSPVLSQGRLGALRGPFSGDDCYSDVRLDGLRLSPIAETPGSFYFMPPDGLATGLHNYQIAGLGIPQSTLPVFYLTLQMWADQTNLHKGQSTTYHLKLSGLNGLPSSAWGSSFFPSDLISPSELQGGSPDAIRTGTITLTITNESPGVISMKNVFATLNAQSFAPSGSFQFDGGVGAILDGGFSILGVSRAYLQPEWSWGSTLGSTLPISSDQPGSQAPASSGTTSMASAPAAPDCDLSDPPPAVLLPVNDLYVNSCMGPDTTRIFDGAMAASGESNSAYIDNPPAKPTVEEAQKRVADAEQAVKDWTKRETDATIKADKAWAAGLKNVPQGFIDDLRESREQGWDAQEKEDSASQAYDKDPSAENKAKLDDAEKQTAFTREHVESAMNAIEERFTPAQRAAYEAANGERKSARYYRARAEDDLEDARNALSQFPLQQSLKYLF